MKAIYSKDLSGPPSLIAKQYRWLETSNLSVEQLHRADYIVTKFQWCGGPGAPPNLPTVYLWTEGLAMSFKDAGPDDKGRPHMLRAEVEVNEDEIEEERVEFPPQAENWFNLNIPLLKEV